MQEHLADKAHYCQMFNTEIAALFASSDALIFAAYILIPIRLWRISRHLPDDLAPEIKTFNYLLAAFVISCGLTHGIKIVSIYANYNWWLFAGVFNWLTAIISVSAYLYLEFRADRFLEKAAKNFNEMSETAERKERLLERIEELEKDGR